MLTKLKDCYKYLLNSDKFEKKGFLCGAFMMCEPRRLKEGSWQIDFYDNKNDEMITYSVNGDIIVEKSKAFSKDYDIKELDIDDVEIGLDYALKIGNRILKEHNDSANKIIIILQRIKKLMWNISYMTDNFNLLNIKIDAINGKILEENFGSILGFKQD